MRSYVLTLFASLVFLQLFAQEDSLHLHVRSRVMEDRVVFRWLPENPDAFRALSKVGVTLERMVANENGTVRFEEVGTYLPTPKSEWEATVAASDETQLAYMALYGEVPGSDAFSFEALSQQQEYLSNAFFTAVLAASFSPEAAEAMAWGIAVPEVPDLQDLYRVYAAAPVDGYRIDTTYSVPSASIVPEGVQGLRVESREKHVRLHWSKFYNNDHYIGYHIYKGREKTGPYERLTAKPYVSLAPADSLELFDEGFGYTDSLGVNYTPFYYQVRGIDVFGIESLPVDTVMGMGRDFTPPSAPEIVSLDGDTPRQFTIEFDKAAFESDFEGFVIGESTQPDGPFTAIHENLLDGTTRRYVHQTDNVRNFYQVAAVDTAGNVAGSIPRYVFRPDTIPPGIPTGLQGVIDSTGVVKLTWEPNPEKDLQGYNIYYANAEDHAFAQINSHLLNEAQYTDTISLKTLTEEVFYRVSAVDLNYGQSPWSAPMKLNRPDIMPPSSGTFTHVEARRDSVVLEWAPSSSKDVVTQFLFRSTDGQEAEVLVDLGPEVRRYVDQTVEFATSYTYHLQTLDDADLRSQPSASRNVRIAEEQLRPDPVTGFMAEWVEGCAVLSWEQTLDVVIYRGTSPETIRTWQSGRMKDIRDCQVDSSQPVTYSVRVRSNDGLSTPVTVQLPAR